MTTILYFTSTVQRHFNFEDFPATKKRLIKISWLLTIACRTVSSWAFNNAIAEARDWLEVKSTLKLFPWLGLLNFANTIVFLTF